MATRPWERLSALAPSVVCVLCFVTPRLLLAQKASVAVQPVPREVVGQRLQRLHLGNAERERELKMMFGEAGCEGDHVQEQVVTRSDPPNVICTLPGATNSLIIVGAHSDHVERGEGAVDDWSGASLLPSLFEALKETPRKHTLVFVGFTDEEEGLVGSFFFVKHFPQDQLSSIKAMVNLECLGVGSTEVWAHMAYQKLLRALFATAQSMRVSLSAVNVEDVGNDDTQAFRDKGLPVITLHSLTQETWPILHSVRDNRAAIRQDHLYESYLVVAEYLAFIDQALD